MSHETRTGDRMGASPLASSQGGSRKWLWIGGAGILGLSFVTCVCIVIILIVSDGTDGDERFQASADDEETSVAVPAGIGEGVDVDGWTVTVTEVRKTPTIAGTFLESEREAIGVYLIVDLAMENTGLARKSLEGRHFRLYDSEGREFEWYRTGSRQYGTQELGSNINPGLTAPGTLIFDLPEGSVDVVLSHSRLGNLEIYLGAVEELPFD